MTVPLALSGRLGVGSRQLLLWALAAWALVVLAALTAALARQPSAPVAADQGVTVAEQGLGLSLLSARAISEGYEIRIRLTETAGGPALVQASGLQLSGPHGALCPVATAAPPVRLAAGGIAEAAYVFPHRECYEPIAVAQSVKLAGQLQVVRDGRSQDLKLRLSRDAVG